MPTVLPGYSGGGSTAPSTGGGGSGSGAPLLVLPPYPPPRVQPVTGRDTLDSTASSAAARQMMVSAENAPIRITYGTDRIGAQLADVLVHGGYWVFLLVWGEGPIQSISLYGDDTPLASGTTAAPSPLAGVITTHYTGAVGQGIDATLLAAYAAQTPPVTYADTLPGIAYSVVKVPAALSVSNFAATIEGRLCYDPETDTTVWTSCPALWLADFVSSTLYGESRSYNSASVIATKATNNELVGGLPRRGGGGLTIDSPKNSRTWRETLATYAGCWTVDVGGVIKLIPDRPTATSETYTHANDDIVRVHSLKKRGVQSVPTVVDVRWTDTSVIPWRERSAVARLAGVLEGTTPRRESVVSLQGIHNYAAADREAIERLNKLNTSDLTADIEVYDRGVAVEVGDVKSITYPLGLTAKLMRVMGVSGSYGRYRLALAEYDEAAYSDSIATGPTTSDTTLPSPLSPDAVTGLTLTEDKFQRLDRTWSSRIRADWTASPYMYVVGYRVEVLRLGVIIDAATVKSNSYSTPAVQELALHTVRVYALSSLAASPVTEAQITPQGNLLVPDDITTLTGFEAGGTVFLNWTAAIDLGIVRTELRYGLTTDTWDDAVFLDRVDAMAYTTKMIPVGTWKVFAKGIDSVDLYSTNAATVVITVTLDAGAFLVDQVAFSAPTLTRVSTYTLGRVDPTVYAVTEDNVAWDTKFSAAMGTYTDALASYSSSGASSWVSELHDFGILLSGDWRATITASALVGSITTTLQLSVDNVVWDDYTTLAAKASAQYARVRIDAAGVDVLMAQVPTMEVRIDAIPREENFAGTSSALGPTTITCTNDYAAVKDITVSPIGTASRTWTYDNVQVGSPTTFDIYIFDPAASNAKVAEQFTCTFKGY